MEKVLFCVYLVFAFWPKSPEEKSVKKIGKISEKSRWVTKTVVFDKIEIIELDFDNEASWGTIKFEKEVETTVSTSAEPKQKLKTFLQSASSPTENPSTKDNQELLQMFNIPLSDDPKFASDPFLRDSVEALNVLPKDQK